MGLTEQQIERYSRHIILQEVGGAGQEKLLASKVLIVGAGGLGAPAALYLAAAGVGTIGIIDADKVDLTNLQRQIIHHTPDVGVDKVLSAKRKLNELNPDVTVKTYQQWAKADNIRQIIAEYDFVIDGTDNFPAKFLVNDACYFEKTPFSHAGILPDWARDGIDGLNRIVRRDMAREMYFARLPPSSPLIDPEGPLWTRHYARGARWVPAALREVLGLLGASSMVIGHTPSRDAKVRARYARRVICIDTGLGREGTGKLSCLLVEKGVFRALYPPKRQVKLGEVPGPGRPPPLPGGAPKAP